MRKSPRREVVAAQLTLPLGEMVSSPWAVVDALYREMFEDGPASCSYGGTSIARRRGIGLMFSGTPQSDPIPSPLPQLPEAMARALRRHVSSEFFTQAEAYRRLHDDALDASVLRVSEVIDRAASDAAFADIERLQMLMLSPPPVDDPRLREVQRQLDAIDREILEIRRRELNPVYLTVDPRSEEE